MGKYLVVANQTASSPELVERLKEIGSEDAESEFVLLVPATPVGHLVAWSEGEARSAAEHAAEQAKDLLEQSGLKVSRTAIGDEAPVIAVQDDLRDNPTHYDAIIVSTLPLGISRWLRIDVPNQLRRRFTVPVIHVVADAKATSP
jgi:nucleotide-binding universal stress UspA family protein